MGDFHSNFEQFKKEFTKERSMIMATNNIISKASTDLRDEYINLLNSRLLLCRLHYMSYTQKCFDKESLLFPLQPIKHLSVANSLRLFSKPNHKDRYSLLIHNLKRNPEVFAQIIYFMLIRPKPPNNDDDKFFVFSTFPSIYNYFLSVNDQISSVSLIISLFKVHFSIHGSNFSKPHKFLSSFITSYFLTTNPGMFFSHTLQGFIEHVQKCIKPIQYAYSKINNGLVRVPYWTYCIQFANELLERMTQSIPLLPYSTRYLISELLKIEIPNFPFVEVFIFDSMFLSYLENKSLNEHTEVYHDICNVFRCTYPQDIIPSILYPILHDINPDFTTLLNINNFINKLKVEIIENYNDELTNSLRSVDECSIYSARDLSLIFEFVSGFIEVCPDEKSFFEVSNAFKGLGIPTSNSEYDIISLKSWSASTPKLKVDLVSTSDINDIIDCLFMIDSTKLKYNSSNELFDLALTYCDTQLSWLQKIRFKEASNIIKKMDETLKVIQSNSLKIKSLSEILFTAVFSIINEKNNIIRQILYLMNIYIKGRIIPFLFELYPNDFNFNSHDVYQSKSTILNLYEGFDKRVKTLPINDNYKLLIERLIASLYIDQLDMMYNFQKMAKNKIESMLESYYNNSILKNQKLKTSKQKILQKVINCFKEITNEKPSENLKYTLDAMKLLKEFGDERVIFEIAHAKNPNVFCFLNYIRSYVTDEKLVEILCVNEEKEYVKRFIKCAVTLWKMYLEK